jgi:hypothetical protein
VIFFVVCSTSISVRPGSDNVYYVSFRIRNPWKRHQLADTASGFLKHFEAFQKNRPDVFTREANEAPRFIYQKLAEHRI